MPTCAHRPLGARAPRAGWTAAGYPQGLHADAIPARRRASSRSPTPTEAIGVPSHCPNRRRTAAREGCGAKLRRGAGTQFDATILSLLQRILDRTEAPFEATVLVVAARSSLVRHAHPARVASCPESRFFPASCFSRRSPPLLMPPSGSGRPRPAPRSHKRPPPLPGGGHGGLIETRKLTGTGCVKGGALAPALPLERASTARRLPCPARCPPPEGAMPKGGWPVITSGATGRPDCVTRLRALARPPRLPNPAHTLINFAPAAAALAQGRATGSWRTDYQGLGTSASTRT